MPHGVLFRLASLRTVRATFMAHGSPVVDALVLAGRLRKGVAVGRGAAANGLVVDALVLVAEALALVVVRR